MVAIKSDYKLALVIEILTTILCRLCAILSKTEKKLNLKLTTLCLLKLNMYLSPNCSFQRHIPRALTEILSQMKLIYPLISPTEINGSEEKSQHS